VSTYTTSDSELKAVWNLGAVVALVVIGGGFLICMGPAGLKTSVAGWQASAYGSDWMVIQYAQSGCIIANWELENEAVQNEGESDGIYFVTEEGPVVHLSGHYTYVQNPTDAARDKLLAAGRCVLD
jgi:hypothetical protein